MKVLKFGGTSVGAPEGRDNICRLALEGSEQSVVVVSALGGVTDMLLRLGREAASGAKAQYIETLEVLKKRHYEAIELSVPSSRAETAIQVCQTLLLELENLILGVYLTSEFSQLCEASVVAYGEKLSSVIITSMIDGATHIDSTEIIKTTPYFERHIVEFTLTNSLIKSRLSSIASKVIVMGGFISSEVGSGRVTNLGRGGSDYTAAIIASALRVSRLYIYTDVDGFLSADPRIVPDAVLIEELGFVEAMELCNFGAKVVYPPTIFPAYNSNIEIVIRNTYSGCAGTAIRSRATLSSEAAVFKGISSINDTALLTLQGLGNFGLIGVNYRLFKTLARAGISIFLVCEQGSQDSMSVAIRNGDCQRATNAIREEFAREIAMGEIEDCRVTSNLAIVAVVGSSLSDNSEATAQIYRTLSEAGIEIIASGQGGAQNSVAFVTELASLRRATTALHSALFATHYDELNIATTGGGELEEELRVVIKEQKRKVLERYGLKLKFVEKVDIHNPVLENRVLVDASDRDIDYSEYIDSGITVVSANRGATLRYLGKSGGNSDRLLYGATIGDSTQLVRTLRELVRSGDTVLSIRALLTPEYCHSKSKVEGVAAERLMILQYCAAMECKSIEICGCELEGVEGKRLAQVCYLNGDGTAQITTEVIETDDPLYYSVDGCTTALVDTLRYREYPLQIKGYEAPTTRSRALLLFEELLSIAGI